MKPEVIYKDGAFVVFEDGSVAVASNADYIEEKAKALWDAYLRTTLDVPFLHFDPMEHPRTIEQWFKDTLDFVPYESAIKLFAVTVHYTEEELVGRITFHKEDQMATYLVEARNESHARSLIETLYDQTDCFIVHHTKAEPLDMSKGWALLSVTP